MSERETDSERVLQAYMRARGAVEPPPELTRAVLARIAAEPQVTHGNLVGALRVLAFGATVAAAAVVAVLAVTAIGLMVGPGRDVGGPTPEERDPAATDVAPSAAPVSPASSPTAGDGLFAPGHAIEIAAVDGEGRWGTIRIERGDELGGYPDAPVPADVFVIEFWIEYQPQRLPEPETFGVSDWVLRPTDTDAPSFFLIEPQQWDRTLGSGTRPDDPLVQYPGAVDVLTSATDGRIAFAVPRREADLELELVYWPAGFDEPAETVVVRAPAEPPPPEPAP